MTSAIFMPFAQKDPVDVEMATRVMDSNAKKVSRFALILVPQSDIQMRPFYM